MAPDSTEKLRILVFPEESEEGRSIAERLKQIGGVRVKQVDSTVKAIDLIRNANWDAVISGVALPDGSDGLELLRSIRRFDQIFPIFFFTSENSQSIISTAFQYGANDYFVADGTASQFETILEAVKISAEISALLRDRVRGPTRSLFEEKYELLFDELKEGSMIISTESGRITYANQTMAEMVGFEADELVGRELTPLLFRREDSAGSLEEVRSAAKDGSAVLQLNFVDAGGSIRSFWTQVRNLELSGKPVLLCQCRDVTRLEQLENEISAVRNQLKVIVENSADAIILAREDGGIEFIGGAAPRMFGISEGDASNNTIDDVFGHQASHIRGAIRQMGSRQRVSGIEAQIVSRWGANVPVSVAITCLPSSDKITRYLFNIMDITAQKVIEAEKLMITELVGIMGSGASPAESLPKLIERMRTKVPIDYGLVVRVDDAQARLIIEAAYSSRGAGDLSVGQKLEMDYLPAEEELWLREGIVRNNLQESGLHPLENLLYAEGARSYLSLPLLQRGALLGGAHFGSSKAYALNRGHLSLFRQIADALAGTTLRARYGDVFTRYRLYAETLAEEREEPVLLCDGDRRVLEYNSAARDAFAAAGELSGRRVEVVLGSLLPKLTKHKAWLSDAAQKPLTLRDSSGADRRLVVKPLGDETDSAGYMIILQGK